MDKIIESFERTIEYKKRRLKDATMNIVISILKAEIEEYEAVLSYINNRIRSCATKN